MRCAKSKLATGPEDLPPVHQKTPLLNALQAITTGSSDRSLAEDPALHNGQAAKVRLLIEALHAFKIGRAHV